MRTSLVLVASITVIGTALTAAGLAAKAGTAQAEQVLNPSFAVDVRPGVKAQGFIALSKPYDTTGSPGRRVGVLAYSIKYLINDQERLGNFGMTDVNADGREPQQSSVGGSGPGNNPLPGEELLPRRFSVPIKPHGDLTWGAVVDREQLDVSIEWVPHQ